MSPVFEKQVGIGPGRLQVLAHRPAFPVTVTKTHTGISTDTHTHTHTLGETHNFCWETKKKEEEKTVGLLPEGWSASCYLASGLSITVSCTHSHTHNTNKQAHTCGHTKTDLPL